LQLSQSTPVAALPPAVRQQLDALPASSNALPDPTAAPPTVESP
jgi:hypothetical protein